MTPTPISARTSNDRGMTTAEYAVGTLASVSLVGILIKVFMSPEFQQLLWWLIKWIFEHMTGQLGM